MRLCRVTLGVALFLPLIAGADPPRTVDVFAGADLLVSPAARGAAFSAGATWAPLPHLAVGADLGYGLLHGAGGDEDRWWLIPTLALRIPIQQLVLDAGAGLGVATVSGYSTWSAYFAQPFNPDWHVTTWAVRGHLQLAIPVTPRLSFFSRVELGTVLQAPSTASEALWFGLSAGIQGAVL
jgi:hypothetical protein